MKRSLFILCALLLLIAGCGQVESAPEAPSATPTYPPDTATSPPTETPQPTDTVQPTDTPQPTATVKPTATPRPTARPSTTPRPTAVDLGLDAMEEIVVDGGFAFRPFLVGMEMEVQDTQALFANEADNFIASLSGGVETDDSDPLNAVLTDILGALNNSMSAELQAGEPYSITVDDAEGLATDVVGTLLDDPVLGQLLVLRPHEGQFFFAFALSNTATGDERWTEEGTDLFATLLDSVRFFSLASAEATASPDEAASPAGSPCPIAVDATYGFTQENAIRVGGDSFGGPGRARAYLDTLLGPTGQAVAYERQGSIPFGDTVLDGYQVSYEGASQPVILYIDQYAFEALYAPVGFTCAIPFPLTAP